MGRVTPTPSQRSDITVISPSGEEVTKSVRLRKVEPGSCLTNRTQSSPAPPIVSTSVPRAHDPFTTPHAQTTQEAQKLENERALKVRSNNLDGE